MKKTRILKIDKLLEYPNYKYGQTSIRDKINWRSLEESKDTYLTLQIFINNKWRGKMVIYDYKYYIKFSSESNKKKILIKERVANIINGSI